MPENPYKPPKEVGSPANPVDWFGYVNAVVVALAIGLTVALLVVLALGAVAESLPYRP